MKSKKVFVKGLIIVVLTVISFFLGQLFENRRVQKLSREISNNNSGPSTLELRKMAISNGDTNAYESLSSEYMDYPVGNFLPIALEMANKHNYSQAYFDVYWTLSEMENINEESGIKSWNAWNNRLRKMAVEYLLESAKLGHHQAVPTVKEYFLQNCPLDSVLYSYQDLLNEYSETIDRIKNLK